MASPRTVAKFKRIYAPQKHLGELKHGARYQVWTRNLAEGTGESIWSGKLVHHVLPEVGYATGGILGIILDDGGIEIRIPGDRIRYLYEVTP